MNSSNSIFTYCTISGVGYFKVSVLSSLHTQPLVPLCCLQLSINVKNFPLFILRRNDSIEQKVEKYLKDTFLAFKFQELNPGEVTDSKQREKNQKLDNVF